LTEEDFKNRDQRWKNLNNEMMRRKPDVDRKDDTRRMPMKDQVAISRLRTGYTRVTHGVNMEGVGNQLCPFCNTDLSVDHILWECKETDSAPAIKHIHLDIKPSPPRHFTIENSHVKAKL
jgi:hypothetical protein